MGSLIIQVNSGIQAHLAHLTLYYDERRTSFFSYIYYSFQQTNRFSSSFFFIFYRNLKLFSFPFFFECVCARVDTCDIKQPKNFFLRLLRHPIERKKILFWFKFFIIYYYYYFTSQLNIPKYVLRKKKFFLVVFVVDRSVNVAYYLLKW